MRIRVDEIPESGKFLRFRWDQSRLDLFLPPDDPFRLTLEHPLDVNLELHKRADHVRVLGTVEGALQLACHRCLALFSKAVKEEVDLFLMEEKKTDTEEDEEAELEAEDLDYEFFDGEVIEIDQLVAEQIFLALPFKVLCSEACRGLCPRCGANLNEEECKCDKGSSKSPFAALESIKTNLPEAGDR